MRNKKTMKVVFMTIGILILALALVILGRFIWCKVSYTPQRIYELNWNMQFPEGSKEEYNLTADQDLRGEGIQYTIFSVAKTNINDFVKDWDKEKNEEFETDLRTKLEQLNVPAEEMPHFEHSYAWKAVTQYDDELLMMYDFEDNLLYLWNFIK